MKTALPLLITGSCLLTGPIQAHAEPVRVQVSVRPFHTGVCRLGKDHLFGDRYSGDDRVRFVIYSFLVEGTDGRKALIDLGPKTTDYCNRMLVRYGLFRDLGPDRPPTERFPDNITQPHWTGWRGWP